MADDDSSSTRPRAAASTKTTGKKSAGGKPTKTTKSAKGTAKSTAKRSSTRAPRAESQGRPSGSRVAGEASRQLAELTSKDVEGVTALQRTDDGWQVELEVLELRRIPTTTDVMATYEVDVDSSGELQGYRRVRRYVRGQAEDGG